MTGQLYSSTTPLRCETLVLTAPCGTGIQDAGVIIALSQGFSDNISIMGYISSNTLNFFTRKCLPTYLCLPYHG